MTTGPVDSHCHLQLLEEDDCLRALEAGRQAGVSGFLIPAMTLRDSDRLLELCAREPDVWCALGVHPHEALSWRAGDQKRLLRLLKEPRVVAVGECGLDFHYDYSPRDVQLNAMRSQWEVALEASMPVIVHNRRSNDVMLRTLREQRFDGLGGVFHSFAGGLQMALEILDRDFTIGFSGMVTFRAADNVREVLAVLPLDKILVETDTPYLTPEPFRGQPNRPVFVVEVVKRIAEERESTFAEIALSTTHNFSALFPKAIRSD